MRLVCTAVTVVGVAVVVALVVRGMDPFTHDFVFNRRAFDAITWGSEPDENGRYTPFLSLFPLRQIGETGVGGGVDSC